MRTRSPCSWRRLASATRSGQLSLRHGVLEPPVWLSLLLRQLVALPRPDSTSPRRSVPNFSRLSMRNCPESLARSRLARCPMPRAYFCTNYNMCAVRHSPQWFFQVIDGSRVNFTPGLQLSFLCFFSSFLLLCLGLATGDGRNQTANPQNPCGLTSV